MLGAALVIDVETQESRRAFSLMSQAAASFRAFQHAMSTTLTTTTARNPSRQRLIVRLRLLSPQRASSPVFPTRLPADGGRCWLHITTSHRWLSPLTPGDDGPRPAQPSASRSFTTPIRNLLIIRRFQKQPCWNGDTPSGTGRGGSPTQVGVRVDALALLAPAS